MRNSQNSAQAKLGIVGKRDVGAEGREQGTPFGCVRRGGGEGRKVELAPAGEAEGPAPCHEIKGFG